MAEQIVTKIKYIHTTLIHILILFNTYIYTQMLASLKWKYKGSPRDLKI